MKGLTVSKKYEDFRIQIYQKNNDEYFQMMRLKLLTDAQIFLAYLYRKNRKNKNKKVKVTTKAADQKPGGVGSKVNKFIGKNFASTYRGKQNGKSNYSFRAASNAPAPAIKPK